MHERITDQTPTIVNHPARGSADLDQYSAISKADLDCTPIPYREQREACKAYELAQVPFPFGQIACEERSVRVHEGPESPQVVDTLSDGDPVAIIEVKDDMFRIGQNRWVSAVHIQKAQAKQSLPVQATAISHTRTGPPAKTASFANDSQTSSSLAAVSDKLGQTFSSSWAAITDAAIRMKALQAFYEGWVPSPVGIVGPKGAAVKLGDITFSDGPVVDRLSPGERVPLIGSNAVEYRMGDGRWVSKSAIRPDMSHPVIKDPKTKRMKKLMTQRMKKRRIERWQAFGRAFKGIGEVLGIKP